MYGLPALGDVLADEVVVLGPRCDNTEMLSGYSAEGGAVGGGCSGLGSYYKIKQPII